MSAGILEILLKAFVCDGALPGREFWLGTARISMGEKESYAPREKLEKMGCKYIIY